MVSFFARHQNLARSSIGAWCRQCCASRSLPWRRTDCRQRRGKARFGRDGRRTEHRRRGIFAEHAPFTVHGACAAPFKPWQPRVCCQHGASIDPGGDDGNGLPSSRPGPPHVRVAHSAAQTVATQHLPRPPGRRASTSWSGHRPKHLKSAHTCMDFRLGRVKPAVGEAGHARTGLGEVARVLRERRGLTTKLVALVTMP